MNIARVKRVVLVSLVAVTVAVTGVAPLSSRPVEAAGSWRTAKQCEAEAYRSHDDMYYSNCINNKSYEGMVFRAYIVVLGRYPDARGFKYWSAKAAQQSSGTTTITVINGLMKSSTFKTKYNYADTRKFVSATYDRAFNRVGAGDPSGVTYWTNQINSKKISRAQFLANFTQNSRTKTTWSLEAPCYTNPYYCAD